MVLTLKTRERIDVFATPINNITPEVELKVGRIGAANYQVPVEVSPARKQTLGLRLFVTTYFRN